MTTRNDHGELGQLVWPGCLIYPDDAYRYHLQGIVKHTGLRQTVDKYDDVDEARRLGRKHWDTGFYTRVYVEKRFAWGEEMNVGTVSMWGGVGL